MADINDEIEQFFADYEKRFADGLAGESVRLHYLGRTGSFEGTRLGLMKELLSDLALLL